MIFWECVENLCPWGALCQNRRFQNNEVVEIYPFKTTYKGWGLCAGQFIPKGTFITQYIGEIYYIDSKFGLKKLNEYKNKSCTYLMSISNSEVIDPTYKGNIARFINHSCDPNCETQKWHVLGEICVGVFAIKDIQENEELTFNYGFDLFKTVFQKCYCGAYNCKGYLGLVQPDSLNSDNVNIKCGCCNNLCRNSDLLVFCEKCKRIFHRACLKSRTEICDFCDVKQIEKVFETIPNIIDSNLSKQIVPPVIKKEIREKPIDDRQSIKDDKKKKMINKKRVADSEELKRKVKEKKISEQRISLHNKNNENTNLNTSIPLVEEVSEVAVNIKEIIIKEEKEIKETNPQIIKTDPEIINPKLKIVEESESGSEDIKSTIINKVDNIVRIDQDDKASMFSSSIASASKDNITLKTINTEEEDSSFEEIVEIDQNILSYIKENLKSLIKIGARLFWETNFYNNLKKIELKIKGKLIQISKIKELIADYVSNDQNHKYIKYNYQIPKVFLRKVFGHQDKNLNGYKVKYSIDFEYDHSCITDEIFPITEFTYITIKGLKSKVDIVISEINDYLSKLKLSSMYFLYVEYQIIKNNICFLKNKLNPADIRLDKWENFKLVEDREIMKPLYIIGFAHEISYSQKLIKEFILKQSVLKYTYGLFFKISKAFSEYIRNSSEVSRFSYISKASSDPEEDSVNIIFEGKWSYIKDSYNFIKNCSFENNNENLCYYIDKQSKQLCSKLALYLNSIYSENKNDKLNVKIDTSSLCLVKKDFINQVNIDNYFFLLFFQGFTITKQMFKKLILSLQQLIKPDNAINLPLPEPNYGYFNSTFTLTNQFINPNQNNLLKNNILPTPIVQNNFYYYHNTPINNFYYQPAASSFSSIPLLDNNIQQQQIPKYNDQQKDFQLNLEKSLPTIQYNTDIPQQKIKNDECFSSSYNYYDRRYEKKSYNHNRRSPKSRSHYRSKSKSDERRHRQSNKHHERRSHNSRDRKYK